MKVFKPVYGQGEQYNAARKHNRKQIAAAKMRIAKARKAGNKPTMRDIYISCGTEPV